MIEFQKSVPNHSAIQCIFKCTYISMFISIPIFPDTFKEFKLRSNQVHVTKFFWKTALFNQCLIGSVFPKYNRIVRIHSNTGLTVTCVLP